MKREVDDFLSAKLERLHMCPFCCDNQNHQRPFGLLFCDGFQRLPGRTLSLIFIQKGGNISSGQVLFSLNRTKIICHAESKVNIIDTHEVYTVLFFSNIFYIIP